MAIGKVGTIAVDFIARTKKFRKDMKRATKSMTVVSKAATMMRGRFAALTAGLTAGGAIFAFQRTANEIDRLAKASDRLGTTTQNLAALNHAASLAGISSERLELGLQRMTRRIGEAAQGGGELAKVLPQLGLSAKELVRLDVAQQFERVKAALDTIPTQSEKLAKGFKFFDSEGVDLVRLNGNLAQFTEEADKLGLLFSREEARKVEAYNDSMTILKAGFTGLTRTLVIQFTPALKAATDQMTSFFERSNKGGTRFQKAKEAFKRASDQKPIGMLEGLSRMISGRRFTESERANMVGVDRAQRAFWREIFTGMFTRTGPATPSELNVGPGMIRPALAKEGEKIAVLLQGMKSQLEIQTRIMGRPESEILRTIPQ